MKSKIIVRKLHSKNEQYEDDEYNDNPEECLDIVEKLRQEAENFIYANATSFQRIITVVRKKHS